MDLDEVAHDEPPHQDLHCLQIQLFSSVVVKELTAVARSNNVYVFCTLKMQRFFLSLTHLASIQR